MAKSIICPNQNCGYEGKPKKKARGSIIIGIILLFIGIIPGLLYFLLASGYRYYCPKYNLQLATDN